MARKAIEDLGVFTTGSRTFLADTTFSSDDSSRDEISLAKKLNAVKVIASKDRDTYAATVANIKSEHAAQLRRLKVYKYQLLWSCIDGCRSYCVLFDPL